MVTAWTIDGANPSVYEFNINYIQSWTHERSWSRTHVHARVANSNGRTTDGLGLSRHSLKEHKLEGVAVDQNEDPLSGADVYLCRSYSWGYQVLQKTVTGADGTYLFYVECPDDDYLILSWKWDVDLGEYIRGVTDRDLKAVAS